MAKNKNRRDPTIERFWMIWNVTEAILLMLAGILGIVVGIISMSSPDNGDVQDVAKVLGNIIPFVTGAFIMMDAIMRVVISFTKYRKDSGESAMMIGAFEGATGIVLMIHFGIFTELVADFISLFMILVGVLLIVFSIYSIAKSKAKIFIPILEILFAAVLIAIGVAILIIYYGGSEPALRERLVLIITGAILLISGCVFLIMTGINRKKQKKAHKEEDHPDALPKEDVPPEPIETQPNVIDLPDDGENDELLGLPNLDE